MRRSLTAVFLLAALAGCGDGEGEGGSFIRASFDGALWSAEASEGQVVYLVEGPDGVSSRASRPVGGGSQFISLTLPFPPDLGTHALDGITAYAAYGSCPNDELADCIYWSAVAEHPGTLTIDRTDPESGLIEGAFSFIGYALGDPEGEAKVFSSGRFRIYAPSVFILE